MSSVESEAMMLVYVVAVIGRDSEFEEIVGYNPIKGFREFDKAKRFAYEQLNDILARTTPPPNGVEYMETTDDEAWILGYSDLQERIVRWIAPHLPPEKEMQRAVATPYYAVLTVSIEE